MRTLLGGGLAFLVSSMFTVACNNECSFFERCNGDVLEVCGDGPDQVVNRKVRSSPCEAPNTICRPSTDDDARCVHASATACDDDTAARCDGPLLLACPRSQFLASSDVDEARFLVATDCRELDDPSLPGYTPDAVGACVEESDGAACGY